MALQIDLADSLNIERNRLVSRAQRNQSAGVGMENSKNSDERLLYPRATPCKYHFSDYSIYCVHRIKSPGILRLSVVLIYVFQKAGNKRPKV
jgi:hypothetical protein